MSTPKRPKVLFIGIDGCRPDALARARTPGLDALIAGGAFTDNAQTCAHSNSGSCWASLLSGVWEDKHGILDNSCEGSRLDRHPTIFARLRQLRPDAGAAAVVHWTTRHHPIMEGVDQYRLRPDDDGVLKVALGWLQEDAPDLCFVLFNQVDHAGHEHGFDPDSGAYVAEIEVAARRVVELVDVVRARSEHYPEDWLICVTTDHGGKGRSHGGDSEEERRTFILFYGNGVSAQAIPGQPGVVDVPATMLEHLQVGTMDGPPLDGVALPVH
ncbi:MAG: alkaline phosphatase family protein [Chromatiales bacterium]|nr:alkaline phosphatase family protein [Chromatiales bacterium]